MVQNILLRNNVKVFGKGKQPLIFAHGFGCAQDMWRFITPFFENDYQIVLFDYVGSGKSDLSTYNTQQYSDLNGYTQDVLDICEALALKEVIFVGHSVSSMIGILSSIKAPQIFDRLILVCPSPCYINDLPNYLGGFEREDIEDLLELMEKNYMGWASFLAPIVMKNKDQPALTEELEASFCSTDPVIANLFAKVTFYSDNRHDLPKVTIDSLILQSSEDTIAPVEVGQYMHRNLSQSTLKQLKATGHCPHMSHPEEVIYTIKEYLNNTYPTS